MVEDVGPRSDLWGLEWDFLAVDSVGHVARLSSSGYGLIPAPVLAAREMVERAVSRLAALPTITRVVLYTAGRKGNFSDWYSMGERGLFAYDWRLWNGPYECIAAPAEPVDIGFLRDDVRAAASILRVPHPFAGANELHLL